MMVTARTPASGTTNDATSGRRGTGVWDWVNADRLTAGATSRGSAMAQAIAATA